MKTRLFGSSGIRGLVNVELTPLLATQIGSAVATFSEAKKVLIARDTRESGPMLEDALISGFLAAGTDADCLGIVPTSVLAFLTKELHADAGLMITASHNPPQYNGIKVFNNRSVAYDEKSQNKIEEIIQARAFRFADWPKVGQSKHVNKNNVYVKMILRNVKLKEKWHVVVDPGCGATYSLAPTIFKHLGCKVTAVNAQPDGFFPGRSPEPNSQSLELLKRIVRELGADAGIAYDGDGDRVAFIDEKGGFADFDRALAMYASHVAKRKRGGIVATNVEASMCVEKMVEKQGGKVVRTRVGDVYVSRAVEQHGAVFGGEPCGAWIHPRFHLCPDGILSSVLLLKALEDENKSLAEFIAEAPRYPILRENIACKNETKQRITIEAGERLKSLFLSYSDFSTIDGARLAVENGWILVRPSGTEPIVRLTVEGESLKAAKEIMKKGTRLVKELIEAKGR